MSRTAAKSKMVTPPGE